MQLHLRWPIILLIVGLCSFAWAPAAHAYIDPGSGSFIFQLIIAFLVGGLFAVKAFWGKIKEGAKKLFKKDADQKTDEPKR